MEVCIVKPDRIFFKEEAEELLLPTSTGYIGVLKEHAPLVTGLDNGVLAVRQGTSWKILALLGGFGVIKEDRVNILCRDIEDAAEIIDYFVTHESYNPFVITRMILKLGENITDTV